MKMLSEATFSYEKLYLKPPATMLILEDFFLNPMRGGHRRLSTSEEKYEESFNKQFQHWKVNS
jgi:hypothetical protein